MSFKKLINLEINDVTDSLLIEVTKNKIARNFVMKNSEKDAINVVEIVQKYFILRNTDTPHSKFLYVLCSQWVCMLYFHGK